MEFVNRCLRDPGDAPVGEDYVWGVCSSIGRSVERRSVPRLEAFEDLVEHRSSFLR